jgi:uncharacterized protein YbbK (DUF523 family)
VSFWRRQLFHDPETATSRPLVATSACLLGEAVRYDGGHKLQPTIESWLAPHLQLQAICPEVGIGLPVPRPTLKLVQRGQHIRVVGEQDEATDVTDQLQGYASQYLRQINEFWPLCAWIFKARSPSCGLGSSIINPGSGQENFGYGAFAAPIAAGASWLVLVEEEDLLAEDGCIELLLLSFLARDILWQGEGELSSLQAHYRLLLDLPHGYLSGTDRPTLWQKVVAELRGADNKKRSALVSQFRNLGSGNLGSE